MNIPLVLALLVKYGNLTREEALGICRPLMLGNQPSRFEDAERALEKIIKDLS